MKKDWGKIAAGRSMLQKLRWGLAALTFTAVGGVGTWFALQSTLLFTQVPSPLPVYGTVPNFHLREQSGKPLTSVDLQGTIWVADFIFTRCPGICPFLSARMSKLQNQLRQRQETTVTLVSFSVDPEWDTPERLRSYAERFGADQRQWLFLTGEFSDLQQLITKGFRLAMGRIILPNEHIIDPQNIMHSDRFVLVDQDLRIRGYYRGTDEDALEQILHDIATLRTEPNGENAQPTTLQLSS